MNNVRVLAYGTTVGYRRGMAMAHNGTCQIYYETFGSPGDPTLLIVNGLGSQCINYHEDWCAMFVARGLQVVRFDNRDVGMSTKFDASPPGAAYNISDMAADAVAVLDALGIDRAHVMGLSMGGMIVQVMAIEHPRAVAVDDLGDVTHRRARSRGAHPRGIRTAHRAAGHRPRVVRGRSHRRSASLGQSGVRR